MAAPRGAETCGRQRDRGRKVSMAKLSLMFESRLVKEVPIGSRAVGIGRSPDNDLPVDNPAVSNHHARVFFEAGRLVVEDLDSLNGTFVNDLRVERATLHDGDSIWFASPKSRGMPTGVPPFPLTSNGNQPRRRLKRLWGWKLNNGAK